MSTNGSHPPGGLRRWWRDLLAAPRTPHTERLWREVRAGHPRFTTAVAADARVTAANRGDRHEFRSAADTAVQALRLAVVTDAFLAQCCYRAKARCQALRIPVVPRLLHRLAMVTGQVCIGDPVVVEPGVYLPHGQVVVDGMVRIESGAVLYPFVTVGLRRGNVVGPTIGRRARIGSGAKVLGAVRVGARAEVGANAVVVHDVRPGATVVGAPAREVASGAGAEP